MFEIFLRSFMKLAPVFKFPISLLFGLNLLCYSSVFKPITQKIHFLTPHRSKYSISHNVFFSTVTFYKG